MNRAHRWPTNGHLIADVAKLGYLDGRVFDATYGKGTFWNRWQPPDELITNDLYRPAMSALDFRRTGLYSSLYEAVVFDPDYKLTGTPSTPTKDARYGTTVAKRWQDRMDDIRVGTAECFRICRRYLLVKCMDQVVSGHVVWQTDEITEVVTKLGGTKVERFDMLTTPQPQPPGRRVVHASANYSTLLVFEKKRAGQSR